MMANNERALIGIALWLAFAACKKEATPPSGGDSASADPVTAKASAAPPEPEAAQPPAEPGTLSSLVAPYEECRRLLANDKGAGLRACASKMAVAAEGSIQELTDKARAELPKLREAATKLAATSEDKLDELRLAFGQVSEPMVALVGAMPAKVAHAYHVFECPMAKGYKRWLQPHADIENPYMGQGMLTCGSKIEVSGSGAHDHDDEPADAEGHDHGDEDHEGH
jgi:hypothetical protein